MVEKRNPKKQRGGQPGNRNARKHGLYSDGLTPEQLARFWEAVRRQGTAPEKAVMDIKVYDALRRDPANPRLIEDGTRILTRYFSTREHIGSEGIPELRQAIRGLLEYAVKKYADSSETNQNQDGAFVSGTPEPIVAETQKHTPSSATEKQEFFNQYFENENE